MGMRQYRPAGQLSERTLRSMHRETLKTLRKTKKRQERLELHRILVSLQSQIQAAARERIAYQLRALESQR